MNTKHRWYDVIVAWANGEKIQVRATNPVYTNNTFEDFTSTSSPDFNGMALEWRVKPKTITKRYRMALVNMYGGIKVKEPYVVAIDVSHFSIDDPAEYNIQGFIRWVGEPIEVEIEV